MFVEDYIKFKKLGLGGDTPTPPTPSESEGIAKAIVLSLNETLPIVVEISKGE